MTERWWEKDQWTGSLALLLVEPSLERSDGAGTALSRRKSWRAPRTQIRLSSVPRASDPHSLYIARWLLEFPRSENVNHKEGTKKKKKKHNKKRSAAAAAAAGMKRSDIPGPPAAAAMACMGHWHWYSSRRCACIQFYSHQHHRHQTLSH